MTTAVPLGPQHLERLLARALQSDRLEGVMHAPASHLPHRLHRVDPGCVDHVRRSELPGEVELRAHGIDGDDASGARQRGAVDGCEPHPAESDDRHRAADLDLRGVVHRSDASGHPAADERSTVERHVLAHLHDRVLVHQHVLGERREVVELVDLLAVLAEPRRLAGAAPDVLRALAVDEMPGHAGFAVAAEDGEAGDHVVPRTHVADLIADRLHHPRRLVPEHGREVGGVEPFDMVEVATAHANGGNPDQHFVADRIGDVHILDPQGLPHSPQYGCLHQHPPCVVPCRTGSGARRGLVSIPPARRDALVRPVSGRPACEFGTAKFVAARWSSDPRSLAFAGRSFGAMTRPVVLSIVRHCRERGYLST